MTVPAYLAAVRASYDTVAEDYVRRVVPPDAMDPVSRGMLGALAELVRADGLGPIADVGCGPGRVTAYLAGLGVTTFGIDLSPRMIELARRAHPAVDYAVGSMAGLPLRDAGLGGLLAWYSTHHTPPALLPLVFAEFRRALAPGGRLLLGGHAGEAARLRPAQGYGHPVTYESYLIPADRQAELLAGAGFAVTARVEQPAEGRPGRSYVCLLARAV
ncbi:class I SAM-dependent methyltransferase [Kitasatospora sp. A2-31]|uniref:class I SAM-dependent methyltransferase n=1 Tax=Kitasatospora sp. A2-31 TaxID=2916414 RepID=UPI001EEA1392|nr:class I SAM-dependent methyltransferase [Kitasatospora sp. A2-31]MCG6494949.1 class I SAM-dependent methyltransferase [Kitasatospora sp. A2-31]